MSPRNYGAIRDSAAAIKFIERIVDSGLPIAFDIEAGYTGEDKVGVSLQQFHPDYIVVGISFTVSTEWARYIPLAHDGGGNIDDVPAVARALWQMLNTGRGVAHNCFAGDTEVITRTGIRKLGDLAGSSADLWTERGWVTAPIIAYPEAETYEVVFAPYGRSTSTVRRTVRATANHRWLLSKASRKSGSGPETWIPGYTTTDQLRPGMVIPDLSVDVTPDLYSDGFRHGLIFADGSRASRSRERGSLHYKIRLCGSKEQYKDRFEKYSYPPSAGGDPVVNWYRSPNGYDLKQLPPDEVDAQYVADFIAGWLAGDGSHNQQGSRLITTTDPVAVEWLERHGALGGFPVSGVSTHDEASGYVDHPFRQFKVTVGGGPMAWTVKEVRATGVAEPVFCPSVPGVERFTLGFGGYTANCAYELKGMSRFFRETLWDDPFFARQVRESLGMFPILADTMLLVWLAADYDPIRVGKDLKSVALEAFNLKMTKFDDLFPSEDSDLGPATKRGGKKFIRFNTRNSYCPKIIEYACEDSVASLMILQKHWEPLKDQLITKVEHQLLPVLVEMEMGPCDADGRAVGNMLFDWGVIRKKAAEAQKFAQLMNEEIQSELSQRLGRTVSINLNSVPQLSKVLFDDAPDGLGLPVKMRSEKTGNPSTSDDALKVIAKSDPIIKKLLEYRQVVKLNGSYLQKFLNELGYSGTGYVFPNHNQAGALTGRMSVDQVSYQQWPKPYHFELSSGLTFDLNFRDLFIAPEGFRIVGFDYANVEMRIAGAISGERKIVDAFNSGMDLHKSTAAATFKVAFDEVTKKQRSAAKTLNFAILYGSGAGNIAEMLTSPSDPVTKEDAEQMLADYLVGYPALADWIASQQAIGREQKFVTTHFGRKFTIWEHYQPKEWIRAKGDRMAVNAPIQGTAADIIKIAMVRAQKAIKKAGLSDKIRMTLTIHDALEFLVHESVSTKEVIDLIEPCVNFSVAGFPLEIRSDWHEGYQWGAVAEVKLSKDKQVVGYELEYEKPWTKEAFKFEGDTLHECLRPYYDWEWSEFGLQAPFYAKRDSEYTVPERQVVAAAEAVVAAVAEEVSGNESFPEKATICISEMPSVVQYERFLAYLAERPGSTIVELSTPEGPLVLDSRHALSGADQPQLSLILGGASLDFGKAEVDADELLAGVEL